MMVDQSGKDGGLVKIECIYVFCMLLHITASVPLHVYMKVMIIQPQSRCWLKHLDSSLPQGKSGWSSSSFSLAQPHLLQLTWKSELVSEQKIFFVLSFKYAK